MEEPRFIVQVYVGAISADYEALSIEAVKATTADEMICCIAEKLELATPDNFELAEVIGNAEGQECKERRLAPNEQPVKLMLLWPKLKGSRCSDEEGDVQEFRFYLREKIYDSLWSENATDPQLIRDYLHRFLYQPLDREYPDLCQLPDLNETTLLENLKARFNAGHIYTYVGSILIAVNPFKFYPIYNPKYVKLYQNRRLGELPPHIFAVADAAYHSMLRERRQQCIVISGESGSGKTESTNFLLHHLTALSQKGSHGSGVEQTILSAGPVLEAFGNAKTAHNNNSSRFGKFIQVTYRENGLVHGALVQKYLLEKSRICYQAKNERNYHVFYHLLGGSSEHEKRELHLGSPSDYRYLNQSDCVQLSSVDESYEFSRLKQSMELVGFSSDTTQQRIFAVLSAVLQIGNVDFQPKKPSYHHDESVLVRTPGVVGVIADLLKVKEETLTAALVSKRARASGETLVINYRMAEAVGARDAMAKCLYAALFDWIVLQLNHALLAKKEPSKGHSGYSIGVLDIFGFEDFGNHNSFEQFCINYANEHLQSYFNMHVFKYEQEEYRREGLKWVDIYFEDNTGCLQLFEARPNGLLCILDDQCSFPGASNETLLHKFQTAHKDDEYYEVPQKRESAFIVRHYAGKVKYQVTEFREKNLDLIHSDMVAMLKSSKLSFVRQLVSTDPVAVFRWAVIRAFLRCVAAFNDAGKRYRSKQVENLPNKRASRHIHNDSLLRKSRLYRSRSSRPVKTVKSLNSVKNLAMQVCTSTGHHKGPGSRKIPGTVCAQFQISLQSLLITLNNANPFFVRCIKSNSDKAPHIFDEANVQRQLRYTGMLETVRIRQSGFNVRLTYEEFIHVYRILLPKGLLSSPSDVVEYLESAGLIKDHYQVGANKIFLRESEKAKLEARLHQTILASIITIQRWFRANAERRNYLTLRAAVIKIQSYVRMILAQRLVMNMRMRNMAATFVQKVWRGYRVRRWYTQLRCSVVQFQARVRGNNARERFASMKEEVQRKKQGKCSHSTDEAFLSKEPSQEELDDKPVLPDHLLDSEGSSGIQEDSEGESFHSDPVHRPKLPTDSPSPPVSPFGPSYISASSNFLYEAERKYSMRNPSYSRTASHIDGDRLRNRLDLKLGPPTKPSYRSVMPSTVSPLRTVSAEEVNQSGSSRKIDRRDSDSDTEGTLISSSRSTLQSTSTSLSNTTLSSIDSGRVKEREQRRLERRKVIAERNPLRSRANSQTEESIASTLGGLQIYTASIPIHRLPLERRYSRDSEVGSPTYQRRESKESTRSIDIDLPNDLHHSKLERKGSNLTTRRNSYTSAVDASPKATDLRRSSEELPSTDPGGGGKRHVGSALPPVSQHKLTRSTKLYKNELCAMCSKTMMFSQGFKCAACRRVFHGKCVFNGGIGSLPCRPESPDRSKGSDREIERTRSKIAIHKGSKDRLTDSNQSSSKWSLTGTSEFTDSVSQVITTATELMKLDEFIVRKIHEMGPSEKTVDRVFVAALKEFKANLLVTSSVATAQTSPMNITYRDLIVNFEKVMEIVLKQETPEVQDVFPVTMGVNAFRGYLNEFVTQVKPTGEKEKSKESKQKSKRKKDRWRKERRRKENSPEIVKYMEHEFVPLGSVITIPTACEVCSSFTWLKEKGLVCQVCKLACHRKCYTRIVSTCSRDEKSHNGRHPSTESENKIFGVPLESSLRPGFKIPILVEKLISSIELVGLYTEGIYRKSGVNSKVHQLKRSIEEDLNSVNFLDYPVHVLTSVLKSYLRELPEPVISNDVYEDLLRAIDISDSKERVSTLFTTLKKLPQANYDLMERLVFHLARVAQNEGTNRMSPNALAIILTPCILRPPSTMPAQDSLDAVTRQTKCLELILAEQAKRVTATMRDIDTLDSAYHAATRRLSNIRSSKSKLEMEGTPSRESSPLKPINFSEEGPSTSYLDRNNSPEEEELLTQQILQLREDIENLAAVLPSLPRTSSEDDLLSTDLDLDPLGSLDELQCPPSPGSDLSVISEGSSQYEDRKRRKLRDNEQSKSSCKKRPEESSKGSKPKISLSTSSIVSQMVKMKEDAIKKAKFPEQKSDKQFIKSARVRSKSSRSVVPTLSDTSVTSVQEGEDAILV
ncbi:unconventional myosin-IXb-like isoform X4 [Artemia franciscana]|uniref:unconventional myosin-IXb-like isoform X4 n=1 Tax=Artemia franciscana TaxID=6661 RepID=UPI0032D9F869